MSAALHGLRRHQDHCLSLNGSPQSTAIGVKQHEVWRMWEKGPEDTSEPVSEGLGKLRFSLDLLL